jgi:hypothetical protein
MPRSYKRVLAEKPDVDVLDWELIERIGMLFGEYAGDEGDLSFHGADSRGEYEESSLERFQAEVEQQDEPPTTVMVVLHRHSADAVLHFQVWWGEDRWERGGTFTSTREADVVYVSERCQAILRQAHERRKAREQAAKRKAPQLESAVAARDAITAPAETGPRRFFYNPWVVTVGGSLMVAAIIAVLVALTH